MIKPATRTKVCEDVIQQMIGMINEGKWPLDEKIPGELELAELFQVSRNSIREALKALELIGVLNSKAGRGTSVSPSAVYILNLIESVRAAADEQSISELMHARLLVEPELTYLAAKRVTKEEIDQLAEGLKKANEALKAHKYTPELGMNFHKVISKIANNKVLSTFLDSITDRLLIQRGLLILKHRSKSQIQRELKQHEAILEHMQKGEAEAAREVMYQHIAESALFVNRD